MTAEIEIRREGKKLHLRMNRPAKRNALTQAMYAAMADALLTAETDGTVAVLIGGAGETFCAGNDLLGFVGELPEGDQAPVFRFLHAIAGSTRILIAAVQGRAVGVGATLLLHCDFVLAEPDAVLSFPFVDLAVVPEAAASLLLPRAIGYLRAAEALMLCEPIAAARALQMGLVGEIVAASHAGAAAEQLASRLLEKPEGALLATKRLMKSPAETVSGRMREEGAEFRARLQTPELRATVAKFFAARNKAA